MDITQLETSVLIKYVVSDDEYETALELLEKVKDDPVASRVLRNYYSELPDAREEMACDLRIVAEKQGVFLYGVKTKERQYLYMGSHDETVLIGDYEQGLSDEDALLYFGYKNEKEFFDSLPSSFEKLKEPTETSEQAAHCVICGVAEGEMHIFGCPVEQCPWCDGQLNRCNCRFDQLGVDEIEDEEQLEYFEELLEQKGRIPFHAEQSPSYPTAGNDPGPADK